MIPDIKVKSLTEWNYMVLKLTVDNNTEGFICPGHFKKSFEML